MTEEKEKIREQQVVILAGGRGTRMRDFGDIQDKTDPKVCPHQEFYILKVRCEQCGTEIDEPFKTTYTLSKETQRIGIKDMV